MKTQELYDTLQKQIALHGRKLDVAIQVNEDEVYLLNQLKLVFRIDGESRKAHALIMIPELFREPTGKPPCVHMGELNPEEGPVNYAEVNCTFCPDCGAKLNHRARATLNEKGDAHEDF